MASNTRLPGFSIYKNKQNQNVYYDFVSKKGYLIFKENNRVYTLFSSRHVLAIIIFLILFLSFGISPIISLLIGLGCLLTLEICFRIFFLYKLPVDKTFVKGKRETIADSVANVSTLNKMSLGMFFSIAIVIVEIINLALNKYEGIELYGQYIIILVGILFFIIYLSAYKKKKNIK